MQWNQGSSKGSKRKPCPHRASECVYVHNGRTHACIWRHGGSHICIQISFRRTAEANVGPLDKPMESGGVRTKPLGAYQALAKTPGSSRVYETTVGKPTRVRRRDNEGPLGKPARVRSLLRWPLGVSERWSKRVCIGGVVLHHGGVILNSPPSLLAESGILPSKYRTLKH